jgi:hypothetical protein
MEENPAPVDLFIQLFIGFQTSKVVQDVFHPQDGGFLSHGDTPIGG